MEELKLDILRILSEENNIKRVDGDWDIEGIFFYFQFTGANFHFDMIERAIQELIDENVIFINGLGLFQKV